MELLYFDIWVGNKLVGNEIGAFTGREAQICSLGHADQYHKGELVVVSLVKGQKAYDKGTQGDSCNRTACQSPEAFYYNQAMQAYYCRACAIEISKWDDKSNPLFPDFDKNTETHRQFHFNEVTSD